MRSWSPARGSSCPVCSARAKKFAARIIGTTHQWWEIRLAIQQGVLISLANSTCLELCATQRRVAFPYGVISNVCHSLYIGTDCHIETSRVALKYILYCCCSDRKPSGCDLPADLLSTNLRLILYSHQEQTCRLHVCLWVNIMYSPTAEFKPRLNFRTYGGFSQAQLDQ